MTFHDLQIGETFEFVPARRTGARVLRRRKISARRYTVKFPNGTLFVGRITPLNAVVYQQGLTGVSDEV